MPVATAKAPATAAAIRPFRIETPEADLEELRARIAATRWQRGGARHVCRQKGKPLITLVK